MLPGKILKGARAVNTKLPRKTTVNVMVNQISKKLSAGDDIFSTLNCKCKQEELRIVFKSSMLNTM